MDRPAAEHQADDDSRSGRPVDAQPEAVEADPGSANGQPAGATTPAASSGTDQVAQVDGAVMTELVETQQVEAGLVTPIAVPTMAGRRADEKARSLAPAMVCLFMIFVSFWLRVLWLDQPTGSLIFDEKYYVSAAEAILGIPQPQDAAYGQSPAGKDPNPEHPPLAKLIMADGIAVLGNNGSAAIRDGWKVAGGQNPWGWRFPSVVAGTLCIAFVYQLARRVGLKDWAALLAAFLFSFDNLVFVTSRIGILDIFMLLGMLAGATFFLARRPAAAGLAFTFGALCKEYGVYGVVIMVAFAIIHTVYQRPERAEMLRRAFRTGLMCVVFLVSFLLALWQLDLRYSTFTNPVSALVHIWDYGTKLTHPSGPTGIESYPWEWLLNEVQIPYLKVTVTVCSTALPDNAPCPTSEIVRQYDSILFRGAMNPYLLFVAPLAAAYVIAQFRNRHDRTALLSIIWFAIAFLPFLPATIVDHRISYIYYMLPAIPAIAIASAQLFSDPRMPKSATVGYVLAILFGFAGYFPFAGFRV